MKEVNVKFLQCTHLEVGDIPSSSYSQPGDCIPAQPKPVVWRIELAFCQIIVAK